MSIIFPYVCQPLSCNPAQPNDKPFPSQALFLAEDLWVSLTACSASRQVTAMAHQYMADAEALLKAKTAELLGEK